MPVQLNNTYRTIYPYSQRLTEALTRFENFSKSMELSPIPPKPKALTTAKPKGNSWDPYQAQWGTMKSSSAAKYDPAQIRLQNSEQIFPAIDEKILSLELDNLLDTRPNDKIFLSKLNSAINQVKVKYEGFDGLYHMFKMPNGEKIFYCNKTDNITPSIKFVSMNSKSMLIIKDQTTAATEEFEAVEKLLNSKLKTSKIPPATILRNRRIPGSDWTSRR